MQEELNHTFADQVRRYRTRKKLSQQKLADRVGISAKEIRNYEHGTRMPRPYTLRMLVRALELDGLERAAFEASARKVASGKVTQRIDWADAPLAGGFYDRDQELAELVSHVTDEACRIVAVTGMGGIGKTTLVAQLQLMEDFTSAFDRIVWRSVKNPRNANHFLLDLLVFLCDPANVRPSDTIDEQIAQIIQCLRNERCLLILDSVDALLESGADVGHWADQYRAYGRLIERLGTEQHNSCLVLTSREPPAHLLLHVGASQSVRLIRLHGIASTGAQNILRNLGLSGTEEVWDSLTHFYAGNPLCLKIIATHIQQMYSGDIAHFLTLEGGTTSGAIQDLLEEQFIRLSARQQEIMYWLAIKREPISVKSLCADMPDIPTVREVSAALRALHHRAMIEHKIEHTPETLFLLQPAVMDYMIHRLVERAYVEVSAESLELLVRHPLVMARAKDHIRADQERLLLRPLLHRLLASYGRNHLEFKLQSIIGSLRAHQSRRPGYAAANALHLLVALECDLTGCNLSSLSIRQADLRAVPLRAVDCRHADLSNTVLLQTFGGVLGVAASPTGQYFAAGCTSDDVRVWHAHTFLPVTVSRGHEDWVWTTAFNSDGTLLATGSDDRTVRLWDVHTGVSQKVFRGHLSNVRSVAFSPHGDVIASGSFDRTVRLWNVKTGRLLKVLKGHTNHIRSVAYNCDGTLLASAGDDQTVRLWNPVSGRCERVLVGHAGNVWSVVFSPDGALLASASEDQTVRLWEPLTGHQVGRLEGHTDDVWCVAFSPDGALLASGGYDQTIRLWDPARGTCVRMLVGHTNHVWSLAFGTQGSLLISGGEDQTVRVWDPRTGQCLRTISGYALRIRSVAFNGDGSLLASAGDDHRVRLWDARSGTQCRLLQGHTNAVRSVAFSPEGGRLASAGADRTIRIWDPTTGAQLRTIEGHTDWVWMVAFSPNGLLIASASDDHTIRLWDARTGTCVAILKGHTGHVRSVAFSVDGNLLASASDDGTVRLWHWATQTHRILRGHSNHVRSVAFSPGGTWLASGSEDRTVRLWHPVTGTHLKTLTGHSANVWSVVFSRDGRMLATGSEDRTVRLWDPTTGDSVALTGHMNHIWSVAISPDQSVLAAGGEDGYVHLWQIGARTYLKAITSERPYARMNIHGVEGLSEAQKQSLRDLGAIDIPE